MKSNTVTSISSLRAVVCAGLIVLTASGSGSFTRLSASEVRQGSATPLVFSVTAQLQKPFRLAFMLRHEGGSPVEVFQGSLPWGSNTYRMLIAVAASGTMIPRAQYIDDPAASVQKLSKGTTLRGTVDLALEFPLLPDIAKRQDVIVFWSYEPRTVDGRRLPRTGGFLLIPKGTA